MSRLLSLYRGGTTVLGPLVALYLARRMARGKEDRDRFAERQGHASRARPPGPLIWVHAASNGEAVSMLSLIDRLLVERPALSVLRDHRHRDLGAAPRPPLAGRPRLASICAGRPPRLYPALP